MSNPGIVLDALPQGTLVNNVPAAFGTLALDANEPWRWWNNIRTNNRSGVRLMLTDNVPLRASRVLVYASDVGWQYSWGSPVVTSPNGNGSPSGGGWLFAGAPQFSIVLYQSNGQQCQIASNNIGQPNEGNFSNTYDILVNVNDTLGGGNDNYTDNGGSYDIWVRVIAK